MIGLGEHAEYIAFAYAGVALVLGGLVARAILADRAVCARIRTLEARGIRRRSEEG